MPSAYDQLGSVYDAWCRSVTEDIPWYVGLAIDSGGPVLEIGVGSGRIAVPTALAGVRLVGVDSSPVMLDLACARAAPHAVPIELIEADMRALPELGRFRLITAPFRVFLHLPDDGSRLAVLCSLRERLRPRGLLAFDVFHPDRLDIEQTQGRWLEREPGIEEWADWRPGRRQLTLRVRGGDRDARMELAWAEPGRWRELLVEAGFCGVRGYGWFDRRPLTPGCPDSVWLAAAPSRRARSSRPRPR